MKKLVLIAIAGLTFTSCIKDRYSGKNNNEPDAVNLGDLTFDPGFNWSSSVKGDLNVTITSDTVAFSTDGQELLVLDENENILDKAIISGSSAFFYITKPQVNQSAYIYLPSTGDKMEITDLGNVEFFVKTNFFNADYATLVANAEAGKNKGKKSKVAATELITNGDFETNDFINYGGSYPSFSTFNKWYAKNNQYDWTSISGNRVYESDHNNSSKSSAYQAVNVNGGDLFTVSANTSGDFCMYIFFYTSGGSYVSYVGYAPGSNNNLSGSGTIPANASLAIIKVHGPKNEWIDNVSLAVDPPVVDSDNDGVSDDNDDYPNDASRAYTSYFPTAGYQTVAFEDLWPAEGDYDFNDMVLSNNVVYTLDANNNKVDATFTMSVDAVGSGFANGLAMVFTDNNKAAIGNSIISGVSGDATLDPDVTNGVIVFPHVFNAQSQYYKNNGVGPAAQPDVFTFTITFNSNVNGLSIIPDTYIYRSDNRGLEVHLDGFSGTSKADPTLYNTIDDVNGTYKTATGLPWAIEIITPNKSFDHPLEKIDILVAYPQFQGWAESNGANNQNWLDNAVGSNVFDLF